jgi:AsmA protein
LKWLGAVVLAPVILAGLFVGVFGWNWLRGPIERMTAETTGRELAIKGDLSVKFGWPSPRLRANAVTFAHPSWAQEKQMVAADAVEVAIDLPQLLRQNIVFPEVWLERPVIFLEQGRDGRKSWLLDPNQQDEGARIQIGRLALDHGTLGYDDAVQKTRIRSELSTSFMQAQDSAGSGLALHGDSLEQLFPLLGIVFPATHAYATEGHLLHAGTTRRYEQFSGHIGASDIAGSLQLDSAGKRPALSADLTSKLLDFDDLGPMIGSRPGSVAQAATGPQARGRVLPDLPFQAERWNSVDAEVQWRAQTLRRAAALPLESLVSHLSLRDSVLTLAPLDFGLAGGQLNARISLDGRRHPIQAHTQVRARKVLLAKLFPTFDLNKNSIGQVNGEFDLSGAGNSIGRMLASSSGRLGLVVAGGEISKLMMEKAGLHLWEILTLNLTGDRLVKLRCAVADFDVTQVRMRATALVFDTEVTTLIGTCSIDLGQETLDLTLHQKTKNTSPLALRSPIYVRGSFAQPEVQVDKGRMAARALGALTLGLVNPLLALAPLIDAGPGRDSDCGQLVREAKDWPRADTKKAAAPK